LDRWIVSNWQGHFLSSTETVYKLTEKFMISYWEDRDVRMGLIALCFWETGGCKEGISGDEDDGQKGCNLLTFNVQYFGRFLKSLIALNVKTKDSKQYSWHWTIIVETMIKCKKNGLFYSDT